MPTTAVFQRSRQRRTAGAVASMLLLLGGCLVSLDEGLIDDARSADSTPDSPPLSDVVSDADRATDTNSDSAPGDDSPSNDGPSNDQTLCDAGWWDCSWHFRRRISFDNAARTTSLTDFPVLVVLDSTRVSYQNTRPLGEDIRFVDADQSTVLAHELERWQTGGTSYVWVKVPRIDGASSSDHMWIYYGNPNAPDPQDPASVWDASYIGVWHLSEDPTGLLIADATGAHHGTPSGAMSASALIEGQIAGGLAFDGVDDSVDVSDPGDSSPLDFAAGDTVTLSVWLRPDALISPMIPLVKHADGAADVNFMIEIKDAKITFALTDAASNWHVYESPPDLLAAGQFHHVSLGHTFGQQTTTRLHVDGTPAAGSWVWGSGDTLPTLGNGPFRIGAFEASNKHFVGQIDEVRISNVARSDDWISAQHSSMTDALNVYGSEQTQP